MAPSKPKVGDAAIIDGGPAVVTAVTADAVEFKCPERIAFEERVAELRAMPTGTEEGAAAANTAKEAFQAEHDAKMPPMEERIRLVRHGHALPGGTVTKASPSQLFWIEYSSAWSCHGRLLPRADTPKTEIIEGHICDVHDEDGNCLLIEESVRRKAKLHRKVGEAYDPLNEVAAHIAYVTSGVEA